MEMLNEKSFASFTSSGKKVVEFTTTWCGDCKRIAPDMPEITQSFADSFQFAEIDADDEQAVAEQYNVKGIPTFIVFEEGKEVGRLPSRFAKTKEQVMEFLDSMK
jgi:thioredoxin-like negative regulator of GroEL